MDFLPFQKAEQEGWNARAAGYSKATGRATLQIIPAMLESLNISPGDRLLDLACGPGFLAGAAASLGAQATGVDFAPAMIAQAQHRYPELPFQVADLQDLPFKDASFNAAGCNIGLFHVTAPLRALGQARRVLRPGGRFAFSQWSSPASSALYAALFDILKAKADLTLADPAPDAFALSDPDHATGLMTRAGFGDTSCRTLPTTLLADGDDFFDFFMRFGVRVPLIVAAQPDAAQVEIRQSVNDAMQDYKTPTGYEVPMPSLLYSGVAA